jgi:hypothetical protein
VDLWRVDAIEAPWMIRRIVREAEGAHARALSVSARKDRS